MRHEKKRIKKQKKQTKKTMLYLCATFLNYYIISIKKTKKSTIIFMIICMFQNIYIFFRYLVTQQAGETGPMPIQCRTTAYDAGPAPNQHRANASCLLNSSPHPHGPTQQTRDAHPMTAQCRANVADGGPHQTNTGPMSRACPAWIWAPTYMQSKQSYHHLRF